jgi:hypothetical protein
MKDEKYEVLYKIFSEYDDSEWYSIITNILEFKSLKLPVIIDSGLPEETLSFIDSFIRKRDKDKADFFSKQLVDYYVTLSLYDHNVRKFKILNWVFSVIKPTKYRYALELFLTREDFLDEFTNNVGEELQLDLISTLSSLRYVKQETISGYLFNRLNKFKSDLFILVSLRYFQKTEEIHIYENYLDQLVINCLNSNNLDYFIESFKELVFQKKDYKIIYDWMVNSQSKEHQNYKILCTQMLEWINYKNKHLQDENHPYCKFIFFELNKNSILPCITIKQLLSFASQYTFIIDELEQYFINILSLDSLFKHEYDRFNPYRSIIYNNSIILDQERISTSYLKNLSQVYHVDITQFKIEKLNIYEFELLNAIIGKNISINIGA